MKSARRVPHGLTNSYSLTAPRSVPARLAFLKQSIGSHGRLYRRVIAELIDDELGGSVDILPIHRVTLAHGGDAVPGINHDARAQIRIWHSPGNPRRSLRRLLGDCFPCAAVALDREGLRNRDNGAFRPCRVVLLPGLRHLNGADDLYYLANLAGRAACFIERQSQTC